SRWSHIHRLARCTAEMPLIPLNPGLQIRGTCPYLRATHAESGKHPDPLSPHCLRPASYPGWAVPVETQPITAIAVPWNMGVRKLGVLLFVLAAAVIIASVATGKSWMEPPASIFAFGLGIAGLFLQIAAPRQSPPREDEAFRLSLPPTLSTLSRKPEAG